MMLPKFVSASQALLIKKFKNIKEKILKCNSNICFNKHSINKNIIQRYANKKKSSNLLSGGTIYET